MANDPIPAAHPCADCGHRDGEWCKWSDGHLFDTYVPFHVTWHSINPDAPENYERCIANTSDTDDEED